MIQETVKSKSVLTYKAVKRAIVL